MEALTDKELAQQYDELQGKIDKSAPKIDVIKSDFTPRPPDFVASGDFEACAWAKFNEKGEIIVLNVKLGEFRFKLRKRFL